MKLSSTQLFLSALAMVPCHAEDAPQVLPPVVVEGRMPDDSWMKNETPIGANQLGLFDAAGFLRTLPGAAVVRNGPQTGIVQSRGLSGDRVLVRVDGKTITPACPNHMDPPLHYANFVSGDRVDYFAGLAPVSEGGDSLGSVLSVNRPDPVFADPGGRITSGTVNTRWHGGQDAWKFAADAAVATSGTRIDYRGSWATANDLRFPGGRVADTGYDTQNHTVIGSWSTAGGFVTINAGATRTRDAGTPALPMDMVEDDSWNAGLRQRETFRWGTLENHLSVNDIDHLMDNFSLRKAGPMPMQAPATSRDIGWTAALTLPREAHTLRAGFDFHWNSFDADQIVTAGPNTGKSRDMFADNVRDRYGVYVDWERDWSPQWSSRLGLRSDVVVSDADAVESAFGGPAVAADRLAFNNAQRDFTDTMVDAVAATRFTPNDSTSVDFAVGIKNRAPSLNERYLWTPANASAGLADGRTYLGNLALDPETALEFAIGISGKGEIWSAELTPFYQIVDGYIQGLPTGRLDSAGLPVLQYQNIDRADLYGAEMRLSVDLHESQSLEVMASYTHGESDETGGDLYRIAPLRGSVDLVWQQDSWESHLECVWEANQDHVSAIQNEAESPGYAVLHFRLARSFANGLRIEAGIENIFDERYSDHLSGINRVSGGDLASGERLPGAGRCLFGGVSWSF